MDTMVDSGKLVSLNMSFRIPTKYDSLTSDFLDNLIHQFMR